MKMPFSRTRRSQTALLKRGSALTIGIVLGVVVLLFILRTVFPGVLTALAAPFWSAGNALTGGAGDFASIFGDKAILTQERDTLARENASLREQNAVLTARVADLTQLLGGRPEASNSILAGVMARPPVSPYDTLVLDAGERAGVRIGASVQGAGGIPLGTIESLADNSSRVLLYSAPGRVTQGWVGENRAPISLEGAGAGAFRTSVPRENAVVVGESVYVAGPGALPIGTVVRVETDPSSPRAVVHIKPVAHLFSTTWVTVSE
ncbi:MAG: rod shape-determining protein MreC [Patescibacteria group bacterium]